jgi:type IV pilus assembly protein PilQ
VVLDRPVDQVLIEARVVIADQTFSRDLGASVSFNNTNNPSPTNSSTTETGFDLNLPVSGGGTFTFGILRNSSQLDIALSALQQEGRGEVVSNPRVITTNQREAVITQGDEIGYTTPQAAGAGQAIATPAFKEALLELKVTPTITTDGRVFMQLAIKKDDIKGFTLGVPSLTKRSVTTGVMVDSGDTVVIGGVYEFRNREDISKLPWIGDVPILGNLFKKKGRSNSKAELLVFVTPRVLSTEVRALR